MIAFKHIKKMTLCFVVSLLTLVFSGNSTMLYSSSSASGRMYCVHNCNSSDPSSISSSYSLNPNLSISSGGDNTETVIGTNDFVPATEESLVRFKSNSGYYYGSGFIIGKHTIVTAGHCVYDRNANEFSNFTMEVTNSQNTILCTIYPTSIHIPEKYHNSSESSPWLYDYALVYVEDEINVNSYGKYNLGVATEAFVSSTSPVYAAGFVGTSASTYGLNLWQKYSSIGTTYSPYPYPGNNYILRFTSDIIPGESGGPVYIYDSLIVDGIPVTAETAIAITTQGASSYNDSIRITPEIYLFYNQFG